MKDGKVLTMSQRALIKSARVIQSRKRVMNSHNELKASREKLS